MQAWDPAAELTAPALDVDASMAASAAEDGAPATGAAAASTLAQEPAAAQDGAADALALIASLKPGVDIADMDDEALLEMLD